MNTTLRLLTVAALTCVATFAACRASKDAGSTPTSDTATAPASTEGSVEAATMGSNTGASITDSIQAHMRMMDTVSAERTKAMVPTHRQLVATMLSRMTAEMRSMNMPADASWNATADSLRQDLTHMPEMSAAELKAMMPAHRGRIMRLMQMHQGMMGKMK